ncbi:MAG: porin family protein [Elusimicrobia bacterium]|nr:porin family protein [Elusimicrobiota bacterium]MBK7545494.1 porin family protein [Elusimicrobiota bacterium]MBK7575316.1 porin family protein [Elusimicrobiota bacterium]MBK7687956.1 porin family protein [Elusimicrobiota bacterium]MBK8125127.1 porin family protein [Elusimicrobiota bacterium]
MKRLALILAAAAGVLPLTLSASDWNGFYVGAQFGAATYGTIWTDINYDWYGHSLNHAKDKILPGAQIGYNRQYDRVVYGVELDYRSGAKRSTRYDNDVYKTDELKSLMTLRLRAGLAADESLLYGTVGAARADVNHDWIEDGDVTDSWYGLDNNRLGLAYGFGLEHRLSKRLSARLEWLHAEIPGAKNRNQDGYQMEISESLDSASLGLNFHF